MKHLFLFAFIFASSISAGYGLYTFSGVQTNVPVSTIDNGGWSVCYSEVFGKSGTSIASTLAACNKKNLMLACKSSASATTYTVAAHAPREDVLYDVPNCANTPHIANDVAWYFSASCSWGFAPAGATIRRTSCDFRTTDQGDKRMCIHTYGSGYINGGWRCGAQEDLNSDQTWVRVILHSGPSEVTITSNPASTPVGDVAHLTVNTLVNDGTVMSAATPSVLTLTLPNGMKNLGVAADSNWVVTLDSTTSPATIQATYQTYPVADNTALSPISITGIFSQAAVPTYTISHTFDTTSGSANLAVTCNAPVFTVCPSSSSLNTDDTCTVSVPDFVAVSSASSSNCDVTLTQDVQAGSDLTTGNYTVVVSASVPGRTAVTCSVPVTVSDNTAPTIQCPSDVRADSSSEDAVPDFAALATTDDNCGGSTIEQDVTAGDALGEGNHTITLTATDLSGLTATCTVLFTVPCTVKDTATMNLTLATTDKCQAAIPDLAPLTNFTSVCPGTVTQNVTAGSPLSFGEHVVDVTVSVDGSSETVQSYITVSDNGPSIVCPSKSTSTAKNIPDFASSVTVNGCGKMDVQQDVAVGTDVAEGSSTLVTITATNEFGISNKCTVEYVVSCDIAITTCPSVNLNVDSTCKATVPDLTLSTVASSKCPSPSVSQNTTVGSLISLGTTSVQMTATVGGSSVTCQAALVASDVTPPTISCPQNITITLLPTLNVSALSTFLFEAVKAADNCGVQVTTNVTFTTDMKLLPGSYPIEVTAKDGSNLSSSCTIEIILSTPQNIIDEETAVVASAPAVLFPFALFASLFVLLVAF